MTRARPFAVFAALVASVTAACGPKKPPPPPAPTARALVVLLDDADTGKPGRIRVANEFGAVELSQSRQSVDAVGNQRPGPITVMTLEEIQKIFGAALSALPPAPRHFTLYFKFESDELTDESRALVPEILSTVKNLAVPEVAVVGHTDTMGAAKSNIELGLKRASTVRNILVDAGLAANTIEVTSHGEGDLLVKTGDNRPEPKNRRVEISVR
jgi:outer membrane protein OmpA-like peptidoglycan-associated protein